MANQVFAVVSDFTQEPLVLDSIQEDKEERVSSRFMAERPSEPAHPFFLNGFRVEDGDDEFLGLRAGGLSCCL